MIQRVPTGGLLAHAGWDIPTELLNAVLPMPLGLARAGCQLVETTAGGYGPRA